MQDGEEAMTLLLGVQVTLVPWSELTQAELLVR